MGLDLGVAGRIKVDQVHDVVPAVQSMVTEMITIIKQGGSVLPLRRDHLEPMILPLCPILLLGFPVLTGRPFENKTGSLGHSKNQSSVWL